MHNPQEKINCFNSVKLAFVNFKNFSGRCRRSEYWYFVGLLFLIASIFIFLTIYYIEIEPTHIIIDRPNYHHEENIINWTAIIITWFSFIPNCYFTIYISNSEKTSWYWKKWMFYFYWNYSSSWTNIPIVPFMQGL